MINYLSNCPLPINGIAHAQTYLVKQYKLVTNTTIATAGSSYRIMWATLSGDGSKVLYCLREKFPALDYPINYIYSVNSDGTGNTLVFSDLSETFQEGEITRYYSSYMVLNGLISYDGSVAIIPLNVANEDNYQSTYVDETYLGIVSTNGGGFRAYEIPAHDEEFVERTIMSLTINAQNEIYLLVKQEKPFGLITEYIADVVYSSLGGVISTLYSSMPNEYPRIIFDTPCTANNDFVYFEAYKAEGWENKHIYALDAAERTVSYLDFTLTSSNDYDGINNGLVYTGSGTYTDIYYYDYSTQESTQLLETCAMSRSASWDGSTVVFASSGIAAYSYSNVFQLEIYDLASNERYMLVTNVDNIRQSWIEDTLYWGIGTYDWFGCSFPEWGETGAKLVDYYGNKVVITWNDTLVLVEIHK